MKDLNQLCFCAGLVDLYEAGYAIGANGKKFNLGSCSTINNLIILKNLFNVLKPKKTMEIGLALASSCLILTCLHRDEGSIPNKQHIAIDPFQTSVWDKAGLMAIDREGLTEYLDFRKNQSSQELPRMMEQGEQLDLVYIDGSHLFEDVFVDFYYTSKLLIHEGTVIFDDSSDPNVLKVIKFIRKNLKKSFIEMDLSTYRSDKGKSLKYSIAKLLNKTQMVAFKRVGPVVRKWDAPYEDF